MLRELSIRDFALIRELELCLYSGFSVLTGETGAGKSIIIDALGLLLGNRASSEMIRSGAESLAVTAAFSVPEGAKPLLTEWGIEEQEELILSREINRNGRNRCRLNGRLVTVGQLAELGVYLVEIVSQHDNRSLLNAQSHLALLDAFGGEDHLKLVKEAKGVFQRWKDGQRALGRLQGDERERNRRLDLLTFQIEEIQSANLQISEEEDLAVRRSRLANLDRIRQHVSSAYNTFTDTSERESVLQGLLYGQADLDRAAVLDPSLTGLAETYTAAVLELEDLQRELRDYLEQLPADPQLLQETELRLELIDNLKRKYGETIEEILAYGEQAEQELAELENRAVRYDQLEKELAKLKADWLKRAQLLSAARKKLGQELARLVENELADLKMEEARFAVQLTDGANQEPAERGLEGAEFLISPNPGEELKPLAKIASGGELSRVALAIKSILAEAEQTPTVIFDEIDAGIGGRTAVNLGEKLQSLSASRQVFCVTHLPVIASLGTNHYSVHKEMQKDQTSVQAALLSSEERVAELTRMLGGTLEEGVTIEHARELLRRRYGS